FDLAIRLETPNQLDAVVRRRELPEECFREVEENRVATRHRHHTAGIAKPIALAERGLFLRRREEPLGQELRGRNQMVVPGEDIDRPYALTGGRQERRLTAADFHLLELRALVRLLRFLPLLSDALAEQEVVAGFEKHADRRTFLQIEIEPHEGHVG